eukprot:jgi/Chlat1/4835/Chrsp31S04871
MVKIGGASLEDLTAFFHLPIEVAAGQLGVCSSALKRRCRRVGIHRWPYRKVRSLSRSLSKSMEESGSAFAAITFPDLGEVKKKGANTTPHQGQQSQQQSQKVRHTRSGPTPPVQVSISDSDDNEAEADESFSANNECTHENPCITPDGARARLMTSIPPTPSTSKLANGGRSVKHNVEGNVQQRVNPNNSNHDNNLTGNPWLDVSDMQLTSMPALPTFPLDHNNMASTSHSIASISNNSLAPRQSYNGWPMDAQGSKPNNPMKPTRSFSAYFPSQGGNWWHGSGGDATHELNDGMHSSDHLTIMIPQNVVLADHRFHSAPAALGGDTHQERFSSLDPSPAGHLKQQQQQQQHHHGKHPHALSHSQSMPALLDPSYFTQYESYMQDTRPVAEHDMMSSLAGLPMPSFTGSRNQGQMRPFSAGNEQQCLPEELQQSGLCYDTSLFGPPKQDHGLLELVQMDYSHLLEGSRLPPSNPQGPF